MLKLSLTATGLFEKSNFDAWTRQKQAAIHQAVAAGMQSGGKVVADTVRTRMNADFTVRKPAFVRSLRAKVFDRDPDRLPALLIGSRIPWLGIHVRGGTLSGRMLIPLLPEHQRMGRKAFRRVIDGLLRTGNAFFIQRNGKAILMAEAIKENTAELRRFKRAERIRTGVMSLSWMPVKWALKTVASFWIMRSSAETGRCTSLFFTVSSLSSSTMMKLFASR